MSDKVLRGGQLLRHALYTKRIVLQAATDTRAKLAALDGQQQQHSIQPPQPPQPLSSIWSVLGTEPAAKVLRRRKTTSPSASMDFVIPVVRTIDLAAYKQRLSVAASQAPPATPQRAINNDEPKNSSSIKARSDLTGVKAIQLPSSDAATAADDGDDDDDDAVQLYSSSSTKKAARTTDSSSSSNSNSHSSDDHPGSSFRHYTDAELAVEVDSVKRKHRAALKSQQSWQRYNYIEVFDAFKAITYASIPQVHSLPQQYSQQHSNSINNNSSNNHNNNSTLSPPPPLSYGLDRIHTLEYSTSRFIDSYERPHTPVMIAGVADTWPALRLWTPEYLAGIDSPYRECRLKAGEDDAGYAVKIKLKHFFQYFYHNSDDSPLYVFDQGFDSDATASHLLHDFTPPDYFSDSRDLFSLVSSSRRPPHRWLLFGPERSGSSLHTDPLATSAWNTLISGCKLWVLFPPAAAVTLNNYNSNVNNIQGTNNSEGYVHNNSSNNNNNTPEQQQALVDAINSINADRLLRMNGTALKLAGEDGEASTYFLRILPRIQAQEAEFIEKRKQQQQQQQQQQQSLPLTIQQQAELIASPLLSMRLCLQHRGETIFVPSGWHHAVLNTAAAVAVTQNFVTENNFVLTWQLARVNRKHMARRWLQAMSSSSNDKHKALAAIAVAVDQADGFVWRFPREEKVREEEEEAERVKGEGRREEKAVAAETAATVTAIAAAAAVDADFDTAMKKHKKTKSEKSETKKQKKQRKSICSTSSNTDSHMDTD